MSTTMDGIGMVVQACMSFGHFRLRLQVPLTSGVVSIVIVHIEGGIGQ
jgi:hypothetical protein